MIQINMDKPDDCDLCKFRQLRGRDCFLNPESNEYMTFEEQYKHCPLIEVKDGCEQKMTHQDLINECNMLQGNVNRMMVTKDIRELVRIHEFAEMRLQKIHKWRVKELVAKMERGEQEE